MGKALELVEKVSTDEDFKRQLDDIKNFSEKIWKNIKLSWYTNHDIKHSESIIELIGQLIKPIENTEQKLTELELFILLSAAYLHDIGMQHLKDTGKTIDSLTQEDYEHIRKWHPQKSFDIITSRFKTIERDAYHVPDIEDQYLSAIAKVAKGHGSDFFDEVVKGFKENPETPDNKQIRCGLLTALLMLGDELDLHGNRVDFSQLSQLNPSNYSLTHWYKHHYVDFVKVETGKVHINLRFPNMPDEMKERIKDEIKQKLEKQIKKVNPIFREQAGGILSVQDDIEFRILKDDTEIKRPMPEEVFLEFNKGRPNNETYRKKKGKPKDTPQKKKPVPEYSLKSSEKGSPNIQAKIVENINGIFDEKHMKPLRDQLVKKLKEYKLKETTLGENLIELSALDAIFVHRYAIKECLRILKNQNSRQEVMEDLWKKSVDILGWLVLLLVNYYDKGLQERAKKGFNSGMAISIPMVKRRSAIEIVFSGYMQSSAKLTINEKKDAVHGENDVTMTQTPYGWETKDLIQNIKKDLWQKIYRAGDDPGFIDESKTTTLNTRIEIRNKDNEHFYITLPGDNLVDGENRQHLITALKNELPALPIVVISEGVKAAPDTILLVPEDKIEGYLLEFFENKPE